MGIYNYIFYEETPQIPKNFPTIFFFKLAVFYITFAA